MHILAQHAPDLELQGHSGVHVALEIHVEIGIDHRIPAIRRFGEDGRRPNAGVIDIGAIVIPGKGDIVLVKGEKRRFFLLAIPCAHAAFF